MKNETKKNEPTLISKILPPQRKQNPPKKSTSLNNAGWLSLINDANAWEQPQHITNNTRHYFQPVDPREFLGIAPPFSWE